MQWQQPEGGLPWLLTGGLCLRRAKEIMTNISTQARSGKSFVSEKRFQQDCKLQVLIERFCAGSANIGRAAARRSRPSARASRPVGLRGLGYVRRGSCHGCAG
eukprot:1153133-Pelagomonas_calceolata.AAC.11